MLGRFTFTTTFFLGLTATLAAAQGTAPPGMVLVKGGKTKMGTDLKVVEKLIERNRAVANTFAAETPEHTVEVEDFYLMPTEVTNEQFAEFVRATGNKPPYYWGIEACEAGRVAFFDEQERLKQEALKAGQTPPERKKFDPAEWWDENWEGADWSIPKGAENSPVNYVTYHDAMAYARWAGMRLMTEEEFVRASRGSTDNVFPWGNDWDPSKCNSLEYKQADEAMPVGSFPDGAINGIYDLIGNVLEWTSSPYVKFDGYRPVKVKIGREQVEALASFDPTSRVFVGGGYTFPELGCRISYRQGTYRDQATEGLGFRCASDKISGQVPAQWLLDSDVRLNVLPGDVEFDPRGTAILQRWETVPGTADVEGYAVVTKYERSLFCPRTMLVEDSENRIASATEDEGPIVLGFLSFEAPLMEPEFDGGTYFLAWRGKGKVVQAEAAKEEEEEEKKDANRTSGRTTQSGSNFWEVPGFDAEVDCLFLYSLEGMPLAAWPSNPLEFKKPKGPSTLTFQKFVPPTEKRPKDAPPIVPKDTLSFEIVVPTKSRSKALVTTVDFKIKPGFYDESWVN